MVKKLCVLNISETLVTMRIKMEENAQLVYILVIITKYTKYRSQNKHGCNVIKPKNKMQYIVYMY